MNETTKLSGKGAELRAKLLATACSAALLVTLCASQPSMASDTAKPIVWFELGGAFTQLDNSQEAYLPAFTFDTPRLPFITMSPAGIQKMPVTSWDGDAKITFAPERMDWALSAGIIYGRADRHGSVRQTTTAGTPYNQQHVAYQQSTAKSYESHMILDFQAGKDVGLGVFGSGGHSHVGFGVRYAQLNATGNADVIYQPTNAAVYNDKFDGVFEVKRKLTGIGPSLSWDASAGLIGDSAGGVSLDWGVNGAVLFGRQRVSGHHQTSKVAHPGNTVIYQSSAPLDRSKQVIVPNLGGFAGISWRYPNAKISMGYRADMFFGAMDGGIDAARRENVGFYGPFASVSIGLGG